MRSRTACVLSWISGRPEQRKGAAFAVQTVLPRGKRDGASCATFPNREAKELEARERTHGEVEFSIGELALGPAGSVRDDANGDSVGDRVGGSRSASVTRFVLSNSWRGTRRCSRRRSRRRPTCKSRRS
jgi:hypothetical protein